MTSSAPLQVKARPGLRQAHRPNGLSGPLGPGAVPGATLRGAGVAGHAADALAAGGVRCGVAGEEGDVFLGMVKNGEVFHRKKWGYPGRELWMIYFKIPI